MGAAVIQTCFNISIYMKNVIVFTLVGSMALFFWQFLSFAGLNLHADAQAHTPSRARYWNLLPTLA